MVAELFFVFKLFACCHFIGVLCVLKQKVFISALVAVIMPSQQELVLVMASLNVAEAHWRDTSVMNRNFQAEDAALSELNSAKTRLEAFLKEDLSSDVNTFFEEALKAITSAIQYVRAGPEKTSDIIRMIFDAREFLSTAKKKLPA